MKRNLFLIILFFAFNFVSAQEEFTKHYNFCQITTLFEKVEWFEVDVYIKYNVGNDDTKYEVHIGEAVFYLTRTSDFYLGDSGVGKYTYFETFNFETNEEAFFVYYHDQLYGVEIINSSQTIELMPN